RSSGLAISTPTGNAWRRASRVSSLRAASLPFRNQSSSSASAAAPGTESALALIDALKHHPRGKYVTVLTNWCGEFSSQEAR
ncbi:hypothetical protein, partial [Klebsiella pneumoniae]|uniref:hypothetical protein n=1 Tax=Klebsiella pneumoniae TaxID=573 RepID=UPI003F5CEC2D